VTLVEALAVLHRAGRIRAPWLGGMFAGGRVGPRGGQRKARVFKVFDDGVGMTFDLNNRPVPLHYELRCEPSEVAPDTEDPATRGCLAALAREAWDVPEMYAHPYGRGWSCFVWNAEGQRTWNGDTEGEAWAAVLIAAAERCTTEVGT
jgi:hypothetical protein